MGELGECKLIPMVIKVDETEGVVLNRPYRYSSQKMDIIDEQVKKLLDVGVIEPREVLWWWCKRKMANLAFVLIFGC